MSPSTRPRAAGVLNAWVDYNGDGDWSDQGEQVFLNQPLNQGTNELAMLVPEDATTNSTWARFRLSTALDLQPTGEAPNGEVEDYNLTFFDNPWTNPSNIYDVNDDGAVAPLDPQLVINELNNPEVSDVITGQLPIPIPDPSMYAPPFLDVNGDGFISPIDALLVINQLNTPAAALSAGTAVIGRAFEDSARQSNRPSDTEATFSLRQLQTDDQEREESDYERIFDQIMANNDVW